MSGFNNTSQVLCKTIDARNGSLRVVSDERQLDAFARLRVSNPFTIFDSKLTANKAELFYDEDTNGTGGITYNTGESSVTLDVSANADRAIRQTYMRFNYQPGKSQLILLTGVMGDVVADTEARIGYFNTGTSAPYTATRDGLYFGRDGTDQYVAISNLGVETKITQSNWNLDKMDGTGKSGITLDFTKTNIMLIDFEWLGVGRVRFGYVIDGIPVYVHQELNANTDNTKVYMAVPNHSIRYEIYSTGGTSELLQICSSVISEGGSDPVGLTRGINTGITTQAVSTTKEALLGYRLTTASLCTTILNKVISIINTTKGDFLWELQLNPTYADTPSWTSGGTSSAIEYAVGSGANTLSADGEVLATGYGSELSKIDLDIDSIIHAGVALDGTRDEIWIVVQSLSGSIDFVAGLNLNELSCG